MALDTDKHRTDNFCPVLFLSHLSKDSVLVRDRRVTGFHAELNLLDFIIKFIIKSSLNAYSSSIKCGSVHITQSGCWKTAPANNNEKTFLFFLNKATIKEFMFYEINTHTLTHRNTEFFFFLK